MGLKSLELSRGTFSMRESFRSATQIGVVLTAAVALQARCHCGWGT